MLFIQAIKEYETYVKVTKSQGTYKYFLGKKKYLIKYLGNKECSKINNKSLLQFILDLRERNPKISNTTINKYLKMVRQVINYSCDFKLNIEKLSEVRKVTSIVPDYTIKKIFSYYRKNQKSLTNIRNFLMIRMLLDTGLRINELINLKISDFDLENNVVLVKKTKTNNERYVFYTNATSELLNKYIIVSKITSYVFINFQTKSMLTVDSVESLMSRLKKKLDIEVSISPHKWRHTFATNFINRRGGIEVLRLILGHASLRTTQKYLHLNKETLQKEYKRVSIEL